MSAEIRIPEVGESITGGILVQWLVEDGETVGLGAPLFEFETDKITLTVNAEAAGRLEARVEEGDEVEVGQVVGRIHPVESETTEEDADVGPEAPEPEPGPEPGPASEAPEAPRPDPGAAPHHARTGGEPPWDGSPYFEPTATQRAARRLARSQGRTAADVESLSPAVRRLVNEHGLRLPQGGGSGRGGRWTKEDVLALLDEGRGAPATDEPASPPQKGEPERIPMSPLRRRIAQRLVEAQQTAAMLTTFNEADMSEVLALRRQYGAAFESRYGRKVSIVSFFVKAVVDALRTVPELGASIDGDEIVRHDSYDVGVAVSTDRGLVVPVLRDTHLASLADLDAALGEMADKARTGRLSLEDLSGGIFTISNGGVFGSLMSTPILNPPQSGILGLHAIKRRPVAVGDEVAIRPMMYLALTYDHRLVDGKQAVTFLRRVVECIENPIRMYLEV